MRLPQDATQASGHGAEDLSLLHEGDYVPPPNVCNPHKLGIPSFEGMAKVHFPVLPAQASCRMHVEVTGLNLLNRRGML